MIPIQALQGLSTAARRAWIHRQMSRAELEQFLRDNPHDRARLEAAWRKRERKRQCKDRTTLTSTD